MRTVTIKPIKMDTATSFTAVRVIFLDGKKKVATFKFFNYIGNGDALARATCDFIMHGIIPHEGNGLLTVK